MLGCVLSQPSRPSKVWTIERASADNSEYFEICTSKWDSQQKTSSHWDRISWLWQVNVWFSHLYIHSLVWVKIQMSIILNYSWLDGKLTDEINLWGTSWENLSGSSEGTFIQHLIFCFLAFFRTPQKQRKAEAAGFRRCQGTYPSCRSCPWSPSIRPCRRVRSLRRRGRLSSQTTVLGSCPDGRLNKKRDCHLQRGIFPGSCV